MGGYQFVTRQVQWVAEIGTTDGDGMGRMESVVTREVFPSKEAADSWLDTQGWIYDERLLRRAKQGAFHGYGLAHVVRREVENRDEWMSE